MNVAQAVQAVARDVGPVFKDSQAQGYSYRGIEDMMNALSGPFAKHGLFVVPNVESVEHHDTPQGKKAGWVRIILTVRYDVYGPDGSHISATVSADALDNSDKGHGKALSYCFKTLVGQLFCISTEEDNERYSDDDHDLGEGEAPARPGEVDAILNPAREAFGTLEDDDKKGVAQEFSDRFNITMKEIENAEQAKGLADIIAAKQGGDTDLDSLRELIDGLEKSELVEWATFCADNTMSSGSPEEWNEKQIDLAFNWLETD